MAVEREKFYECEVKRRRVKATGGYEPVWKVKIVPSVHPPTMRLSTLDWLR